MKLIERDFYLDKLKNVMGTPDIKVITGVRRCGKSKLMDAFIDWIKKNKKDANIIHINYNLFEFDSIKTAHALDSYVEERYQINKTNFLLIDEVQLCTDFEKVINSFHASEKYDIYITGSNAFLLSSDLATLFTGRVFQIKVFPFSFLEYQKYFNNADPENAFDSYVKEGGMSGSFVYKSTEEKYAYIKDVFDTLITRDIVQKYKIKNELLLNKLNDFMLDNISSEVSVRKIADTLTSNQEKTNDKTIGSYLNYLCNAFAFYKVRRYDIRGKKYLASQDKYYLADHSFRYAILGTKNMDYGRVYENMVCIELLRRGYEVYTGVLYKKEIDFVAIKQSEKIYIQVSDDISLLETLEREVTPLLSIKDAYPKVLIARTRHEKYLYEGISIINLADFLLGKE
ncbi:MAG: ATP-binding protein [Spirochaetales bacterium]|nr:ATP-binding protein [Spirochaetales bacterium]MDY5916398.1 ATP-binding protein [Treponema sp.]